MAGGDATGRRPRKKPAGRLWLHYGEVYLARAVTDNDTREAPVIRVDRKLTSSDVLDTS